MIKIKRIGSQSVTEMHIGDRVILVSYETPVAYFAPGEGFVRTSKRFSKTTSKHINQFFQRHGAYNCGREVSQEQLEAFVASSVKGE